MFEQTFVREGVAQRPWTFILSAAGQSAVVGVLLILTILRTELLPRTFGITRIAVPIGSPPAPPEGIVQEGPTGPSTFATPSRRALLLPDPRVPIATVVSETVIGAAPAQGIAGSVPGGVPPGEFGGILPREKPAAPPPPPAKAKVPEPPAQIRVGGNVQSAKLIRQVTPVYPALARQARIQGVVRLNAVISTEGVIRNLIVESGPPLLVKAAVEAVSQWAYAPTTLNGRPVEVVTVIEVNFRLGL